MNKTLYIRDSDADVWERAEALAAQRGTSVSQLATEALRSAVIPAELATDDPDMTTIEVETGESSDDDRTEGFVGKWLVRPHSDGTRADEDGWDAGSFWGVALTKRGKIAVYISHCNNGGGRLDVYEDLDDAGGDVPENILAQASSALGVKRVIWRDI